jgi:hypothetical protein
MSSPLNKVHDAWRRFWFEPQETSSLALFRIAFGVVATAWTATQIPNLFAFYGPHGILPDLPARSLGSWGVLALSTSPALLLAVFAATLAAAMLVTVGLFTRVASIVLWVGILSLEQRNMLVSNSGDGVLRSLAFFCALAPTGASLSLDRLRKAPNHFWEFPSYAPWPWRLIQIQLSIGYLSAVWHKSHNALWTDGTAVSYALRMLDIHRLGTPAFITQSELLVNVLTYGTMAIELSLGILVWNRVLRPWTLLLGVSLHLGIDSSIMVGFFSYAMLAGYLAFVPPPTASRFILAVRDRVTRVVARGGAAAAAGAPPPLRALAGNLGPAGPAPSPSRASAVGERVSQTT